MKLQIANYYVLKNNQYVIGIEEMLFLFIIKEVFKIMGSS